MNKFTLIILTILLTFFAGVAQASEIEIKQWEKQNFKKLDTDNNGSLDATEMRGTTRKWMTNLGWDEEKQIKMTNNKFKKYDGNKDHKVSLKELVIGNRKQQAMKKKKKKSKKNKMN